MCLFISCLNLVVHAPTWCCDANALPICICCLHGQTKSTHFVAAINHLVKQRTRDITVVDQLMDRLEQDRAAVTLLEVAGFECRQNVFTFVRR